MLFDSFLSLSPASTTTPWRTLSISSAQRLMPDCCVFVPTLLVHKFVFVCESVTDSFSPAARRLLPDCRGGLAYTCVPRRHGTYFYDECFADSGQVQAFGPAQTTSAASNLAPRLQLDGCMGRLACPSATLPTGMSGCTPPTATRPPLQRHTQGAANRRALHTEEGRFLSHFSMGADARSASASSLGVRCT